MLAAALEADATAHEQGTLSNMDARIIEIETQLKRINDIPRPTYKMAMRFWKEWAWESTHGWSHYENIGVDDWPELARTIAAHVRTGTLPPDKRIIMNFVRRKRVILWRNLKNLFGDDD